MKLGTGDIITLDVGGFFILHSSITLNIDKQRVYWVQIHSLTELSRIISSDYDGEDRKNMSKSDQKLNRFILDVSDNSIFVMKNDEASILMMNEKDSNLFGKITIEKSNYLKLIVFNNKLNHTAGE